ncbi:MAG: RNA polymerase sigma factor [Thermodesulfobacteriota bacterium]
MFDSLLEKLTLAVRDGEDLPDQDGTAAQSESSFLEALPIVQYIVRRRRAALQQADISDLAQGIALRLWKWRGKYREKSENMSSDEWNSFAARTAYNEVNRHFSKSGGAISVDIENALNIAEPSVEGETEIEVFSLISAVWQEICHLSLRQRRALLLHSQELVIYFMQSGITDEDLAQVLGMGGGDWNEIRNRLPLSDVQIAEVIISKRPELDLTATARSIKKARHEARTKLGGVRIK